MKKLTSAILTLMMLTSVFAGINVFAAEVTSSPAVHMQETVVYHETFEDFENNPNPDFELNSYCPVTYEDRGDGNGKALVMSAPASGTIKEYNGGWVRFLHNAAGDRAHTLHEYLDDSDVTEISVDIYSATARNQSINMAIVNTNNWDWRHSIDISENGYVYYPDWELVNNTRTAEWGSYENKDLHKYPKDYMTETCTWTRDYTADYEAGKWNTFKFVFDKRSKTISTYINDVLIGRRVHLSTWQMPGLLTVEDEDTAEPNEVFFKIDNFKIVQKNYAAIANQTYLEDFDTTGTVSFDESKHWASWWATNPKVVDTGDAEHGKAMSLIVRQEDASKEEIDTSDEFAVRFLVNKNMPDYMNADVSIIEADFKLPARRRMAIEFIDSDWKHHSVIISLNDWACFLGDQGSPKDTGTNAHKWQTQTMKQMLKDNAEIATGHIAGFPTFYDKTLHNEWHHIRFVRDKVNKTLTAYLDDVCLGTRAFTNDPKALAFSSQTYGIAVGAEVMMVDNIRIGSIADVAAPSLSITDTEGNPVSEVTAEDTYYAKMDGIKNNTNVDKKMQLFVAAYDENNCFLGVDSYAYTVPANTALYSNGEALGVVQLTAPTGANKMKVFAWSDFDTNIPLCATAEVVNK